MSSFLDLAQTLQMAIKALQMYTSAHPRSQDALQALAQGIGTWLKERPELQLAASSGKVFVDGSPVEGSSLHLSALVRQLSDRQISGFVIRRGVPAEELLTMLEILILKPAKLEELGGVARVMASKNLQYIALSQTQYREVREGGGDEADEGTRPGTVRETPAPAESRSGNAQEPLAIDIAEALDYWRRYLEESTKAVISTVEAGLLGFIPAANLANLGRPAEEAGWGPGFPTAPQMESLRQAFHGLGGELILSVLKGLGTLPLAPGGLNLGFQALSPELIARASTDLLGRGIAWSELKDILHEILALSPQKQGMLAGLESGLRGVPGAFDELLRQLEWENQPMDEKIRRALDEGRLWDLTLEQRLAFLKELLKQGRTEPFLRALEQILATLTSEDPRPREAAAVTLAGVTHWTCEPQFPLEAEGLILDGLKGNFGWEPVPHIHRSTEEGLEALLACFLRRGELEHVQGLVQELGDLLVFMEDRQEWRIQSLERMTLRLVDPEIFTLAVEALHRSEPGAVAQVFVPYFTFLGGRGAEAMVRVLGEEPDRKRRARLLEVIRDLGPLALSALTQSLGSPTWYLVRNTLNLLADMGDASLLGSIAQCLQHGDGRVRRAAVRALWKLGGPVSAGHLLGVFPATDPETQVEILFGLGQIRSGAAVHPLADFAKSTSTPERLRLKTLETLALIGHPTAIQPLVELIRRKGRIFSTAEPQEIRVAAARALAAIGTPQAMDALRALVEDEPRNKDREALQAILTPQGRP